MADLFPAMPNGTPLLFTGANTIPVSNEDLSLNELLIERGTSGLRHPGGFIREEYLPELTGQRGMQVYREMGDMPVPGGCLFAVEMLTRNVTPRLKPADGSAEAAKFANIAREMLFEDMDVPWSMQTAEEMKMVQYGFALFELVLKQRLGPHPPPFDDQHPRLPSRFNDGLIGIGKLAPRAQDTVLRWQFNALEEVVAVEFMNPWMGRHDLLPFAKLVLFRPTSYRRNPEGRSALRSAYRPYYFAKHSENFEAIGGERNLVGIPLIYVPPEWMSPYADASQMAQFEMVKRIGRNVRQDQQACIVLPAVFDADGNRLVDFQLIASPGQSPVDMDTIIKRHELRITQSILSDVIMIGHEAVGSFALHSGKTNLLSYSLGGYLTARDDVYNREILPLLWRLNAFPERYIPTLEHGDIETVDWQALGSFIKDYSGAGFDVRDLDNHFRMLCGFPERDEEALARFAQDDEARAQRQFAMQAAARAAQDHDVEAAQPKA